jgi:hypothetical protein
MPLVFLFIKYVSRHKAEGKINAEVLYNIIKHSLIKIKCAMCRGMARTQKSRWSCQGTL